MTALILRLEGPMMSFGGPLVDHVGVSQPFPPRSLLAGLLGNALGYTHDDCDRLDRLQQRLRYAVRRDRAGESLRDYQTVFFGQAQFQGTGWTTRGRVEERGGDAATKVGTHIRVRDYFADAQFTVAISLAPEDEEPTLQDFAQALRHPARPLFLGRKACLPATPLLVGVWTGEGVPLDCLREVPRTERSDRGPLAAWWGAQQGAEVSAQRELVATDSRDWRNQIHVGRRHFVHGTLDPSAES